MDYPDRAINDPDNWLGRWRELHNSDLIFNEVHRLALREFESPHVGSTGEERVEFDDKGQHFSAEISFHVEGFPRGRVFFVLSILSEGDPIPPPRTPR